MPQTQTNAVRLRANHLLAWVLTVATDIALRQDLFATLLILYLRSCDFTPAIMLRQGIERHTRGLAFEIEDQTPRKWNVRTGYLLVSATKDIKEPLTLLGTPGPGVAWFVTSPVARPGVLSQRFIGTPHIIPKRTVVLYPWEAPCGGRF